jgi:stage II sporulation protein E
VAHLLRDTIRCDQDISDRTVNHLALEALQAYLAEHQIPVEQVLALGKERLELRLIGTTAASLSLPTEQFRQDVSKILGAPISRLHFDADDVGCLSFHTLPPLRADYVHRSLAAQQTADHRNSRNLCGDTLRVFVSEEGMLYALICDGMGNGREAAMTSGAAGIFLERTLRAGVEVNTALRMLNHYLLSRATSPEEEISATIDLFALNLYTKQGYFLKSGAAPSLILREGRMFRLSSHTLPIGILQAIDTQIIPFDVQAGDHILLMSDGVCDVENEDISESSANDWLAEYLAGPLPEQDDALIGELFSRARDHGSCDDMSIISIRISEDI